MNLILKGSFDIEKLKELEPPIYVTGFVAPPDDPNAPVEFSCENVSEIIASGKEVIYLSSESSEAKEFFEKGLPIIYMEPMKLDEKGKISPIDGRANSVWYNQIFGKKCEISTRF